MTDKERLLKMLMNKRAAQLGLTVTKANYAALVLYNSQMLDTEKENLVNEISELSKYMGLQKIFMIPKAELDSVE